MKIVKVEIIGEETVAKSGVGRAVVGGLLFGEVGAVVGALTKKDDEFTTFRLTLKEGKTEIVKAKKGSFPYKTFMNLYKKEHLK